MMPCRRAQPSSTASGTTPTERRDTDIEGKPSFVVTGIRFSDLSVFGGIRLPIKIHLFLALRRPKRFVENERDAIFQCFSYCALKIRSDTRVDTYGAPAAPGRDANFGENKA